MPESDDYYIAIQEEGGAELSSEESYWLSPLPNQLGSLASLSAFSTRLMAKRGSNGTDQPKLISFVYGANVVGISCGVYGYAGETGDAANSTTIDPQRYWTMRDILVDEESGEATEKPVQVGVAGRGGGFGVYGGTHPIGAAGIYGETGESRIGVAGVGFNIKKDFLEAPNPAPPVAVAGICLEKEEDLIGRLESLPHRVEVEEEEKEFVDDDSEFHADGRGIGLFGATRRGTGVYGQSELGNGGKFRSKTRAQVRLVPIRKDPESIEALFPEAEAGELLAVIRRGVPPKAELWFCTVGSIEKGGPVWQRVSA